MKLYKFIDDEVFWICARNQEEAHALYLRDCTEEAPEDLIVKESGPGAWGRIMIADDDVPGGRTTAAETIGDPTIERDAFLVAASCY